jgi:hypothetical protein
LCADLEPGADGIEVARIKIERTCIYFDCSGALLIPKSFAKLCFFVCAAKRADLENKIGVQAVYLYAGVQVA